MFEAMQTKRIKQITGSLRDVLQEHFIDRFERADMKVSGEIVKNISREKVEFFSKKVLQYRRICGNIYLSGGAGWHVSVLQGEP